jgi:hypothetical protein
MTKGLLDGVLPDRPLFVPVIFSLGARIENLALGAFLNNPTKICNALRQTQGHLRADGLVCYCDPFLEAEALGGTLEWDAQGSSASLKWSPPGGAGKLPGNLRSAEESSAGGRVPTACEILRRMASLPHRDFCLAVTVSGPFTLAARLLQLHESSERSVREFSEDALELANSTITEIVSSLLEAGAELVFIQEDILPPFTAEHCAVWAAALAPTINVVRFYQALPVLRIPKRTLSAQGCEFLLDHHWNCIICLPVDVVSLLASRTKPGDVGTLLGISLPAETFSPEATSSPTLHQLLLAVIRDFRPVLVTTQSDVPATGDLKAVIRAVGNIRSLLTESA